MRRPVARLALALMAFAAMSPVLSIAQTSPGNSLVIKAEFTIYSGDVNGDGHVDVLAKAKAKFAFISLDDLAIPILLRSSMPTFVVLSSGSGSYSINADPSPAMITSGVWQAGTHDLRFGDILGNGAGGAIIEARSAGHPSFSFAANASGQPQLLQTLNSASLGYDLSASGTTTELSDRNGDGRTDLTVLIHGLVASVFHANTDGIFVANQESTIRATWLGFKRFLEEGNSTSALAYISAASVPIYTEYMQRLGANLPQVAATLTDIKAVRLGPDFATFAVFEQSSGQRTLHFLVFTREEGRWVLEAL